MKTILFNNNGISPEIKFTKELKSVLASVFKTEKVKFERISYIFCDDKYLLNLNQEYLKHNSFTDILTFTLSDPGEPVISDIYLSVERIKANAKTFKTGYPRELLRVMIHGALHLCGYQDRTAREKMVMRSKEDHYLKLIGFT